MERARFAEAGDDKPFGFGPAKLPEATKLVWGLPLTPRCDRNRARMSFIFGMNYGSSEKRLSRKQSDLFPGFDEVNGYSICRTRVIRRGLKQFVVSDLR